MTLLLAATSGGHLTQLHQLSSMLPDAEDRVWVTNDTAQSRSLLKGETVFHVPYPTPRDVLGVVRDIVPIHRFAKEHHVALAVSTGSSIAISTALACAPLPTQVAYVESATRVSGVSLTGKVLQSLPGVRLYVQYPELANWRWHYGGSVFERYTVHRRRLDEVPVALKILVTVGGTRQYGFRRLLERLVEVIPASATVIWQTGCTDVRGLDIDARPDVPSDELQSMARAADVVVCHAGTGSILSALQAGKRPVVVPRLAQQNEHVDGHQEELAALLARRGLATVVDASAVSEQALREAATYVIRDSGLLRKFRL